MRDATRGDRQGIKYDRNGNPELPPAHRVHGVKLVLTNPDNRGDTHQFWLFTLQRYTKWGQWYVHIVAMSERHGMELSDDTIPPDPTGENE